MPIPPNHALRNAYHFVHLDNLESIIINGLLSNSEQERRGIRHHSIAIPDIQRTRSTMDVTCTPGGVVHDYVPFYFCKRTSMLLNVVNARNVDQMFLIYLAIRVSILDQPQAIFTDESANRRDAPPEFYSEPSNLEQLNWEEIDSLKWTSTSDHLKHQKMAELLVHGSVPWNAISKIVVWNDGITKHIKEVCKKLSVACPTITEDSRHYYTKYPTAPTKSLVTGPYWTSRRYDDAVKAVLSKLGTSSSPQFQKLWQLRDGLRANISCIPETAELVGLASANVMHSQDLGQHTMQVAANLRALPEFNALKKTDQLLVEIAAYLHDIGKGPKSRWASKGGVYQNDKDHPVDALPMVSRVLIEEVATMKKRSVKVILKLVCYHDLIGDIIGHGRIEDQLFDVIDDECELDMLIALSKADTQAVQDVWWNQSGVDELRDRAVAALNEGSEE